MFEITREIQEGYVVYNFKGTLNKRDLLDVRMMVEEDINITYYFIFNLSELAFIDGDAMYEFTEIYKMAVMNAADIYVCSMSSQSKMMFEIFRNDQLYTTFDTCKEAITLIEEGN